MLIKELIRLNTNAEFFSDVQLRWFWEPAKNAKLAKGYIFTRQASDSRKSTVDALDAVRFGLTDPGSENRMLFLATFGQGKTHLALAMANFFAKPPESPEVQCLIESLKCAYNGSAAISNFTDLKERNPKHLVVCLQGDEGGFDLASYFVREVERSLSADLSASGGMLPLWFKTALETIDKSVAPHQTQANEFLAAREMDLPQLRQRLEKKDASLYDVVCDLIQHVTGVPPNLGPRLALHKLVSHVCSEYCGAGKPYAGLIVLFDEFNAFMHAYSKRDTTGTPLQDLLNGIANNRETSVFVGFAQRDPMTIVNALPPTNRDALTVEMSRIPQDRRMHLFNNLETVLDAYIGADEATLRTELESAGAWPALEDAEEATLTLFSRRYDRELKWNLETFRKNVTIGCFPLHPLTTALLCSVDLAETGNNARGLLQFVLKSQDSIEEQPVAVDGVPTWIYATRMVDWFEKTLCSEEIHWEQYQKAVFDGGGDLSNLQKNVLKAMLLHLIAKLPTASVRYERTIALLAGVKEDDAKNALMEMATRNLIERDAINNKYAFYSASGGDRDLREYIKREVENTSLKLQTLQDPGTIAIAGFRSTEVPVVWGNAVDWQANPTLLTSEFFAEAHLKGLLAKSRTPVVWLIPQDENDRSQIEAKAQAVVDAACGAVSQPLVIFLPNAPYPGVLEGLRKLQVIDDLPTPRRIEYAAFLQQAKARINDQIREQTLALRSGSKQWFAHSSLKAGLQADNVTAEQNVIRRVVMDCFKTAPPSFITNQKEESPKLRKATLLLSKLVLVNQVSNLDRMLSEQPNEGNLRMAKDILDSVLTVGRPAAWGVIGGSKHLQEPAHNRVRLAWEQFSNTFPPNGTTVYLRKILETLQKPPYGYDSNTLTLLACAWIGFHRHDLQITQRGSSFSVARMQACLDVSRPADFIAGLLENAYAIKRRDPSIALQEINTTLAQVQRLAAHPLSQQEATEAVTRLDEFIKDESNRDHVLQPKVIEALERIQSGLKLASDYDREAEDILSKLMTVRRVTEALTQINKAQHLPQFSGVKPMKPTVSDIIQTTEETLDKIVAATCSQLSSLKSLTDYGRQEDELKGCLKALKERPHLHARIGEAISALSKQRTVLEEQQSEDATLRTVQALSAQVPMLELEKNLETLNAITSGSEKVAARRTAKRKEITDQITGLTAFAEGLAARINSVKDANGLRALEKEIDGKASSFAGHEASEAKLKSAIVNCSQLAEFFSTITRLEGRGLNNPQDLATILEECATIRQKFSSGLSPEQAGLIEQIESSKRNDAEAKSQAAKGWLEGMENAWKNDGSNPTAFLHKLSGSPAFLPEDAKVTLSTLRAIVREKLEEQQSEDATLRTVQALSAQVPMLELEKNLETLNAITSGSEKVAARRTAKRKEITDQITGLTAFAEGLAARISSVKDANGLRALEKAIDGKAASFAGHEASEAKLNAAIVNCSQLAEFFSTITRLEVRGLNNPQDLATILEECATIRQKFSSGLSPEQARLIEHTESTKRNDAEAKSQAAKGWLEGMENAWKNDSSNPTAFLQKLNGSPAFLPEDAKVMLSTLRAIVREKLEEQQSEEATLRTVQALSAQVPMLELEKNLETLNAITSGSEKVASRRTAKRKEITDQITGLTTFAEGLADRISSVKDANGLRALEKAIDGKAASFAGHEASEAKLNAAIVNCSQLAEFFSTITRLEVRGLNNPQDLATILEECATTRQKFSSGLSPEQAGLIEQIESSKRNDAEAKSQAAKGWLQGMENTWKNDSSNPTAFLQKLNGSPAFLPEDAKVMLSTLRAIVREKLESSEEEWIVSKFQGISDKNRRQKLVKRLHELLSAD